jgi:hypothetical protein
MAQKTKPKSLVEVSKANAWFIVEDWYRQWAPATFMSIQSRSDLETKIASSLRMAFNNGKREGERSTKSK